MEAFSCKNLFLMWRDDLKRQGDRKEDYMEGDSANILTSHVWSHSLLFHARQPINLSTATWFQIKYSPPKTIANESKVFPRLNIKLEGGENII